MVINQEEIVAIPSTLLPLLEEAKTGAGFHELRVQ